MAFYTIWVGGERSWHRSYLAEIGGEKLTKEQVAKYFTFDKQGGIEFDQDLIAEKTDWNCENSDLPTWDTITDGCMGWGAYTDQMLGVCRIDDEDNPLVLREVCEFKQNVFEEFEDYESDDVWILYNSYEKGGYQGTLELPDNEEFDPEKLVVDVTDITGEFYIVTGASYNGIDIYMEGDSTGKGIDWYVYHKGEIYNFR
jgi:hypothetical protein